MCGCTALSEAGRTPGSSGRSQTYIITNIISLNLSFLSPSRLPIHLCLYSSHLDGFIYYMCHFQVLSFSSGLFSFMFAASY